jgi:hypothetical protein
MIFLRVIYSKLLVAKVDEAYSNLENLRYKLNNNMSSFSQKMIPPPLSHAMKQFPEHKEFLAKHYRKNEVFRSLCRDFLDCRRAVEFWCQSSPDNKHADEICQEYKALFAELKDEIARWQLS